MGANLKEMTANFPTMKLSRTGDGRLRGVDQSVWLYFKVPTGPVADARSFQDKLRIFTPLMDAFDELATMVPSTVNRRSVDKAKYRKIHLMMTSIPRRWRPGPDHVLSEFLRANFPEEKTIERTVLLGVKLVDRAGGDGGIRQAIDSVVHTLVEGGTLMSDFDADASRVSAAMARAGLSLATAHELNVADAWWNQGVSPETVNMPCAEHLHIFSDHRSVAAAQRKGLEDCHAWPQDLIGHNVISFGSLADLDIGFTPAEKAAANWIVPIIRSDAMCISLRGMVEPAKITRDELRRQRKRYMDDIRERARQLGERGEARAEQAEAASVLRDVEAVYATGDGTPTLVNASLVMGFDGEITDFTALSGYGAAQIRPMSFRQSSALAETMLCSPVQANPNLHDFPSQTVVASGIQSLSKVGDRDGIFKGFTENDGQPVWYSPEAAYVDDDAAPVSISVGASGSGKTMMMQWDAYQTAKAGYPQVVFDPKALALDTPLLTTEGWTTIGESKVGQHPIGRDGLPCTITAKSPVFSPDQVQVFDLTLSDGTVHRADAQHRWVVATPGGRRAISAGKGMTPEQLSAASRSCLDLVASVGAGQDRTANDLLELLHSSQIRRWTQGEQLVNDLLRAQVPYTSRKRNGRVRRHWDTAAALRSMATMLSEQAALGSQHYRVITTAEMIDRLHSRNDGRSYFAIPLAEPLQLPEAELPIAPYLLGVWLGDWTAKNGEITASKDDSAEMLQIIRRHWPSAVVRDNGRTDKIFCPADESKCRYGHEDYRTRPNDQRESGQITYCGACAEEYRVQYAGKGSSTWKDRELVNPSLHDLLRRCGLLKNKHIPEAYLMGSYRQRLELLQGLMDTDGTVNRARNMCKIVQVRAGLAEQIALLVRSLGMKASLTTEKSWYYDGNGERVWCQNAHGVVFQPSDDVFQLERKRQIQPDRSVRSRWLYVTDITAVDPEPMQCISVDSPDHTYLTGRSLTVTHNTGSDLSPSLATLPADQRMVYSLDRIASSDGVFDPLKFSPSEETGIELSASMIATLNPWGTYEEMARREADVINGLRYGVSKGARATGLALRLAAEDGIIPDEIYTRLNSMSAASPMFRSLFGHDPDTPGLRLFDGTTLIKVGDANLTLPEPGQSTTNMIQRVNLALVKMVVFGSAMALNKRKGVIRLDEAWVFLSSSRSDIERLARVARSQNIQLEMYTQKISDALDAGIKGFITRGTLLHVMDEDEAIAACKLLNLDPDPYLLSRIRGLAVKDKDSKAPNWDSLRALKDPKTGQVIRGTVSYQMDTSGRTVPVESRVPDWFLLAASTNSKDIAERERQAQAEADRLAQQDGSGTLQPAMR